MTSFSQPGDLPMTVNQLCLLSWVCGALTAGAVLAAAPFSVEHREAANRDTKALARMVNDLVNANKAPPLIQREHGKVPLFPTEYDWKEQERVWKALKALRGETTPELWDVMVNHAEDKRYALTLQTPDGRYSEGNWSVGDFCAYFAFVDLVKVYER